MSRNEIRLRRQRITARGAERFRNYGAILQRHERDIRLRKIFRVFTFFAVILIITMIIIILTRIEKKSGEKVQPVNAWIITNNPSAT